MDKKMTDLVTRVLASAATPATPATKENATVAEKADKKANDSAESGAVALAIAGNPKRFEKYLSGKIGMKVLSVMTRDGIKAAIENAAKTAGAVASK